MKSHKFSIMDDIITININKTNNDTINLFEIIMLLHIMNPIIARGHQGCHKIAKFMCSFVAPAHYVKP